jgi:hypothetical protein
MLEYQSRECGYQNHQVSIQGFEGTFSHPFSPQRIDFLEDNSQNIKR